MADDWDLHAVVRSCTSATTSTTTTSTSGPPSTFATAATTTVFENSFSSLPSFVSFSNPVEELHELYKPFFPKTHTPPPPPPPPPLLSLSSQSSPISSSLASFSLSKDQTQSPTQPKQSHAPSLITTATNACHSSVSTNSQPPRSKRRKNQQKRVCHVPADAVSSDEWAWRKYGQKPIKGSPYPRGYYRCSSSKGCLARKQVERNRSDPTMFIVTYTGEHNHPAPTHRNSLAGSTRQKPFHPQTDTSAAAAPAEPDKATSQQPSCSSPANSVSADDDLAPQSTKTESIEDMVEDEEDEPVLSDMAMSDDFFEGLEKFDAAAIGDSFPDLFPANFGVNWVASSAATAAGGT